MTKDEAIIASAYTGVSFCGFSDIHGYVEKLLGRPVFSHEFASEKVWEEINEKVKPHFMNMIQNLT